MLSITILGNNSAIPAYNRNPTAQVVQYQDDLYLIDCGEGTQLQLARYRIRRSKINHIFISHLHGDHYFGLIGLLNSMSLLGRTQPVHLYGPPLLQQIIQIQLDAAEATLSFPWHFHPITSAGCLLDEAKLTVHCFPVTHRIACWGFVFRQKKKPRKINPERAQSYGIPNSYYEKLQQGHDYRHPKGTIVPNDEVTIANTPAKSYAYCADTIYDESILEHIRGVDLLYHETTYLRDQEDRAKLHFHSTTVQAATLAQKAGAKRLLIGHFSSKYEDLTPFLTEAQTVFPSTELAIEGMCFPC